ncbi:MAG TPA: GNAT family N-acetyltransferase [Chthonomonadaceae bacterium]|nr:GNAT family N-acetyltransferase [Chthonomonadaceae bacterium]
MLTIRPAQWPHDVAVLSGLDTSFVTERIYRPIREELSFRLIEERVSPPHHKQYAFHPDDPTERQNWDYTAIAEEEGKLAGFMAAQYVSWNRRVVLWHLYVTPSYRHLGVGTRLLAALEPFARSTKARCLWLETQNTNYPAIQFYRRCGFTFCGFDETLYDPEILPNEEVALFFARPIMT